MAVLWHNTFDGANGIGLTVANSADHGDPVAAAIDTYYSTAWAADGGASARLGSEDEQDDGFFVVDLGTEQTPTWSLSIFISIPAGGWLDLDKAGTTIFYLDDDFAIYEIGDIDVSAHAEHLIGQPVRIDVTHTGGTSTYRAHWTNPYGGDPDFTDTAADTSTVQVFDVSGGGFDTPPSFVDVLRIAEGDLLEPIPHPDTQLLEELRDTFSSESALAHWQWYANGAANVDGRLRLPAVASTFANARSFDEWTLHGSSLTLEVPTVPAAGGATTAYLVAAILSGTSGTSIQIRYWAPTTSLQLRTLSGSTDAGQIDLPYDHVAHRWWRIRETDGTLYFETSPNSSTWTIRRQLDTPSWVPFKIDVGLVLEAHRNAGGSDHAEIATLNAHLLRLNSCDGPDGVAVTTANSGGTLGHPWAGVSGTVTYSGTAHLGAGSIHLDADEPAGMVWGSLALGDFAVRGYLYRPAATTAGHIWWAPHVGGCSITSGAGLSWLAGLELPDGSIPAETWVRVEATRAGTVGTLSVWSTDPESTGAPDATDTGTIPDDEVTQWWWEHLGAGGILWDELALDDRAEEIGPVTALPPTPTDPLTAQRIGWGMPIYLVEEP